MNEKKIIGTLTVTSSSRTTYWCGEDRKYKHGDVVAATAALVVGQFRSRDGETVVESSAFIHADMWNTFFAGVSTVAEIEVRCVLESTKETEFGLRGRIDADGPMKIIVHESNAEDDEFFGGDVYPTMKKPGARKPLV